MIICFSTEENNLDSLLTPRFEEANYFLFLNVKTSELEVIKRGKLGQAAYLVAGKRPNLVITGNLSPDSFDFLFASGVKIASGIFGITAKRALKRYQEEKIKPVTMPPGAAKGRLL